MMKTGKIVKENQPRPLPNSGNKTSGISSAISRRKLEYKEKLPLAGKKIYLNLKGVRQERRVEEKLEKLGAIIEKFLSKEIHYFVTDQDKEKSKNDDQSPNGSPNVLISSPFNSAHTPSPSNLEKKTFTVTRGRAMLQCAKKESATDNIVERAKKLGVKVVPYLSLMKWLIKEQSRNNECVKEAPPPVKKAKVEDNQKSKKILSKARNLKQPFIKFEAVNKFFRPVQVELKSWPYLNMNSARGGCPFDDWLHGVHSAAAGPSRPQEVARQPKNKPQGAVGGCGSEGQREESNRLPKKKSVPTRAVEPVPKTAQGRRLVNWERRKLAEKKLRQGFCECCEMRFDDLKKHLNSTEHSMFVKNETNYHQLDNLITNGYNVQQFVSKVSDHHKFYPENGLNSLDSCSSSPGKIMLLTLSSSTSIYVKASADPVAPPPPETKHISLATSSESETVTSQTNVPSITENKILLAKNLTDLPMTQNPTAHMKTPVKPNSKIPAQRKDGSLSALNNMRSPLKCILNSPSRIDLSTAEKLSGKPKGLNASLPVATAMVENSRSLFLPELQPHSKNGVLGAAGDQNENVKPAKCSPPSFLEDFPVKPKKLLEGQLKSDALIIQENSPVVEASSPRVPFVNSCSTPGQALLNNTGKNLISPLESNSSGSKCSGMSLKRNIRCSSVKAKSQRLFKLGEKWHVLSQQSVKKILFGDESPEPFKGFDPQDVFRNSDNSDFSYETISEVILTDPSEFEWVLGTCEGKQVTDGVHSDPSSQTTVYNSKNVPFGEYSPPDCSASQEKSVSPENNFKKYVAHVDNNGSASFCRDRGGHHEYIEPNSTDEGNSIRGGVNSDSPKEYNHNVDVYLNSHKDFPPYIPNGQTSGYCSPSFQPTPTIEQSLVPENQHFPVINDFETKVIQDLDYSQTPRYLHFESVDPVTSQCPPNLTNNPVSYNHPFQEFQYTDLNPPSNLDARLPTTFADYPRLFHTVAGEQSCGLALSQESPLENSHEQGPPNHYTLSGTNTPINYKENTPLVNNILQQTPLPNLAYEYSSLSVMSVDRTLNDSDPNLDTPPEPPVGSSNSSNNNNNSSFEAIPVLNFDSSFSFPVQNFPVLSDFPLSEDKRSSYRSNNVSKDPGTPLSESFLKRKNLMVADSINVSLADRVDKNYPNGHKRIEIDRVDLTNAGDASKYNDFSRNEISYFNSCSASVEDGKGTFSDTICTAETHSLISSLSQNAIVPLKTCERNHQADLDSPAKLTPEKINLSLSLASPQTNPQTNFTPSQEPVLENEIIMQLSLGCDLQTSPPLHRNPPSLHTFPKQENEDLDMPPQLQLEGQQLPLPLDAPYQLSPPKLMLEEVALQPGPPLLPLETAEKEPCSLAASVSGSSSLFGSLSPSRPGPVEPSLPNNEKLTIQENDSFLPLTKSASGLQDLCKFNMDVYKYLDNSCTSNPESIDKYHSSDPPCPLVNDSLHHRPWDTETNLVSISYNSVSDQKPPRAMYSLMSSSSLPSSDSNVHGGNSNYKSDNEITDPLQKHSVEGMDTSDDTTGEWNGSKNETLAEIKDSGFFSVEEVTPRKSPLRDSHRLLSNIARPCSVVLEKSPETLLVQSRFPLQKDVDQQNTFSVKRVRNAVPASPNSKSKPRLLKRLSDNQKTFRLDYIHGNYGGRKNLSRVSAAKTRNILRQNARFK